MCAGAAQQGTHLGNAAPVCTLLQFSARLRLPCDVDAATRGSFVREVS